MIEIKRTGICKDCPFVDVDVMFNDPYQDFVHILAQLPAIIIPADKEERRNVE